MLPTLVSPALALRAGMVATLSLGLLAPMVSPLRAQQTPEVVGMAVSFSAPLSGVSEDGEVRLSLVCAVTEYPMRSDPRFTLRDPYLVAEISADADAFVFHESREAHRMLVSFAADDAPLRWAPQEMTRVRPAASQEMDINRVLLSQAAAEVARENPVEPDRLDQAPAPDGARLWRAEGSILLTDELREAQSLAADFTNPYAPERRVSVVFSGGAYETWAGKAHSLARCCGVRGDGRTLSMSRLPKTCERRAETTRHFKVDYASRRILEEVE